MFKRKVKALFVVMKRHLKRSFFYDGCGFAAMLLVIVACALSISDYNKDAMAENKAENENTVGYEVVEITEERIPMAFEVAIKEVEDSVNIELRHDELDISEYCSVFCMNEDDAEKLARFKDWGFFIEAKEVDVLVNDITAYPFEIIAAVDLETPFTPEEYDLSGMNGMNDLLCDVNGYSGNVCEFDAPGEADRYIVFYDNNETEKYLVVGRLSLN